MFTLIATLLLAVPPQPTDGAEEASVAAVIDRMHAAAARADGPTYFAQFTAPTPASAGRWRPSAPMPNPISPGGRAGPMRRTTGW